MFSEKRERHNGFFLLYTMVTEAVCCCGCYFPFLFCVWSRIHSSSHSTIVVLEQKIITKIEMFRIIVKPGITLANGKMSRANIMTARRCLSVIASSRKREQLCIDCLGAAFSRSPNRLFSTTEPAADAKSEVKDEAKEEKTDDKNSSQLIRRIAQEDDDYYDDYDGGTGKTGYKKYFTYFMVTAISGIVLYASYSIGIELFGRSAPGHLYDETFEIVRVNDEVCQTKSFELINLIVRVDNENDGRSYESLWHGDWQKHRRQTQFHSVQVH
jgi:hypothetical protein